MIDLMKNSIFRVASILVLTLSAAACSDDSDSTSVDNAIDKVNGIGVRSLEFELPAISKLITVAGLQGITLELKGVDDMQTYDIEAEISHDGDTISISAEGDEDLASMPHQDYYLNFIKFYSNETKSTSSIASDERSVTLGALLSLSDPNNIEIKSTFNELMQCFGQGTEKEPYSIVTILCIEALILDKLTVASETHMFKDIYFQQTRDINFADEYEIFNGWTAMGKYNINGLKTNFCGVYDGGRNIIQDLLVTSDSSSALFYSLGDGAIIRNIRMTGFDIDGGLYTGAVACKSSGDVLIQNVDVYGNIQGAGAVGGMIGEGSATFKDCYVGMNISDNGDCADDDMDRTMGGFIGSATGDCSFDVCAYSGTISNSSDDTYSAGGFIGRAGGESSDEEESWHNMLFMNCAVAGEIGNTAMHEVGGLIGYCGYGMSLLMNNVIIGSQLYMDADNAVTESIFGDSPIFSNSSLNLRGTRTGGYIGVGEDFNKLIFSSSDSCISSLTTIESSECLGGVIGYAEGAEGAAATSSSLAYEVTILDRIVNNATMSTYVADAYNPAYLGGVVGYSSGVEFKCNNSQIYNDPTGVLSYADEVCRGSFAGYFSGTLTDVYFENRDAETLEFFGNSDAQPDTTGSTFTNNL